MNSELKSAWITLWDPHLKNNKNNPSKKNHKTNKQKKAHFFGNSIVLEFSLLGNIVSYSIDKM
jgi:hypothetical protein